MIQEGGRGPLHVGCPVWKVSSSRNEWPDWAGVWGLGGCASALWGELHMDLGKQTLGISAGESQQSLEPRLDVGAGGCTPRRRSPGPRVLGCALASEVASCTRMSLVGGPTETALSRWHKTEPTSVPSNPPPAPRVIQLHEPELQRLRAAPSPSSPHPKPVLPGSLLEMIRFSTSPGGAQATPPLTRVPLALTSPWPAVTLKLLCPLLRDKATSTSEPPLTVAPNFLCKHQLWPLSTSPSKFQAHRDKRLLLTIRKVHGSAPLL